MSEGTKVTIYAAPKVLQDMIEDLYDSIAAGGNELEPVTGGNTSASATILPPGPSDQVRWAKASPGWFNLGNGPEEAIQGKTWLVWWNKVNWYLKDMGTLPAAPPVTKPVIQEFAYTKDQYVTQNIVETANPVTLKVNGDTIVDPNIRSEYLKKLDQSLKDLRAFGVPEGKYLVIRQFTIDPAGNIGVGFGILNDTVNVQSVSSVAFNAIPYVLGIKEFIARERYSNFSVFGAIDTRVFGGEKIEFNFREPGTGDNMTFKNSGIKIQSVTNLPVKTNLWGLTGFNMRSVGAVNGEPQAYYMHQAIKSISFKSDVDSLARIDAISYNEANGRITFVIFTCDDDVDNSMVINDSRNGFANLKIEIPLIDTGINRYKTFVSVGSSTIEGTMVFDIGYLKSKLPNIETNDINIDRGNELAHWLVKANQGGVNPILKKLTLIEGGDDFEGNFRFAPSTGNSVYDATYNKTKAVRIPDGAETLTFMMSFDGGYSNGAWYDKDLKFLSWVYNSAEPASNLTVPVPNGALFTSATTKTAMVSAKIIANGSFELTTDIKHYGSITEGLFDKFSGPVFQVNDFLYKKKKLGICTVNDLTMGNQETLNTLPKWEKDGAFRIPTDVLHTDGVTKFTGGSLVEVKNGVMYFYNANDKAIFKSIDGGESYITILDRFSHPGIWDSAGNTEGRSSLTVLDDGELLIPIRVQGAVLQASPERRERYWSLYRTINNQTGLVKCFDFSHEDVLRHWLPPSDPQYLWGNYSGGCLLGNFTVATLGSMVVVTEYGAGTSEYWSLRGINNNARGISGRAWVSFDFGKPGTWSKMFDADRKKVGTEEAEDNWFYFTSTYAAKMRHMHGVDIDPVRGTVQLTNGDNEDYVWMVGIEELRTWYNTASRVNPNEKPEYKISDTFPEWSSPLIVPSSGNSIDIYSSMRAQIMKFVSTPIGRIGAHDAPREFVYLFHFVNGRWVLEPIHQFERVSDYPNFQAYAASWVSTDGFIQRVTIHNGVIYFSYSNGGAIPSRVDATINGIDWVTVYEGANADIKFAGGIFLDDKFGAFLSNGTFGQASNVSGYWKLKKKMG